MTYVSSQAFAGRSTVLQFNTGSGYQQLGELKKITFSGSKYDLADTTNMQSGAFREWLPTLADSGDVSFDANYLVADPGQNELLIAFNNASLVNFEVVLPVGGHIISLSGFVQEITRDFPVDKPAQLTGKIKITGAIAIQ